MWEVKQTSVPPPRKKNPKQNKSAKGQTTFGSLHFFPIACPQFLEQLGTMTSVGGGPIHNF